MTKKEYLLKLLTKLAPYDLPISADLVYLLEHNQLDDSLINTFYEIFSSMVSGIYDKDTQQKIQDSIAFVQMLKSIEEQSIIKDQKDIDELDHLLSVI